MQGPSRNDSQDVLKIGAVGACEKRKRAVLQQQVSFKALLLSLVSITVLCQTFSKEDWFMHFVQTSGL